MKAVHTEVKRNNLIRMPKKLLIYLGKAQKVRRAWLSGRMLWTS